MRCHDKKHILHYMRPEGKYTNFNIATCVLLSELYPNPWSSRKHLFHFSTWHRRDTYVFGHMTLRHRGRSIESEITTIHSVRPCRRPTPGENSRRAALLYFFKVLIMTVALNIIPIHIPHFPKLPITTVAPLHLNLMSLVAPLNFYHHFQNYQ